MIEPKIITYTPFRVSLTSQGGGGLFRKKRIWQRDHHHFPLNLLLCTILCWWEKMREYGKLRETSYCLLPLNTHVICPLTKWEETSQIMMMNDPGLWFVSMRKLFSNEDELWMNFPLWRYVSARFHKYSKDLRRKETKTMKICHRCCIFCKNLFLLSKKGEIFFYVEVDVENRLVDGSVAI